MQLGLLKWLRFLVPGVLIFLYAALIIFITTGRVLEFPDFSKAQYLPIIVVPAVVYYATKFRYWINNDSSAAISEKIRSEMVIIAGHKDNRDLYSWKKLRSLFYKIIDEHKSLSEKKNIAYFNGMLWTSFADSIAISSIFIAGSLTMYFLQYNNSIIALISFIAIFFASVVGHQACEKKQIEIAAEQLEIIKSEYRALIEKRLNDLDRQ